MAKWQRTLNLLPEWERAKNDEITVTELGRVTADRLSALRPFGIEYLDTQREELAEQFRDVRDVADFDYAMSELYDWADTPLDNNPFGGLKVCWVRTF